MYMHVRMCYIIAYLYIHYMYTVYTQLAKFVHVSIHVEVHVRGYGGYTAMLKLYVYM